MPPIDATLGVNGWEVQPIVNMATQPVTTWARRAVVSGGFGTSRGLCFFTDVGEHGTLMQWTGARWRALNGSAVLKSMAGAEATITNTARLVMQALIPAGAWQTNDVLLVKMTGAKSGGTDTFNITGRIGTAGTASDQAITGLSAFIGMAAVNVTGGWEFPIKLVSATSAQRLGNASTGVSAYGGTSNNAAHAATTITDASANALYLSIYAASSGATDTLTVSSGTIQLITP